MEHFPGNQGEIDEGIEEVEEGGHEVDAYLATGMHPNYTLLLLIARIALRYAVSRPRG
jgi:hypothetical protein